MESFGEPLLEDTPARDEGEFREADALRTAILVFGLVLLIPSLVLIVFAVGAAVSYPDYGSDYFRRIIWVSRVFTVAGMVGAAVVGYLLVRIAKRRLVYSVRDMLYPALVVVGAYLMLMATFRFLQPVVTSYAIIGIWDWGMAISALFHVPYIVGGLLLVMIGRQKYPRKR